MGVPIPYSFRSNDSGLTTNPIIWIFIGDYLLKVWQLQNYEIFPSPLSTEWQHILSKL